MRLRQQNIPYRSRKNLNLFWWVAITFCYLNTNFARYFVMKSDIFAEKVMHKRNNRGPEVLP